jgi:tRNA-dihydrouridine synthase
VKRSLTDGWMLGGVPIPNRLVLAPLAGIGNWFVRLQAKRYGAGLVVSEMVSSFAIHYRNERTLRELLRIHPDEHPVSVQLFGHDPDVMESAAERVAAAGADMIDINMGCPVPKVCKTGAGAALLEHPEPVLVSGGLGTAERARAAFEATGSAGVLMARGSLGNPWVFEELLGIRDAEPEPDEILAELDWVIERAVEHLGVQRATRYLRKFYPWYIERLGRDYTEPLGGPKALQAALQSAPSLDDTRALFRGAALAAGSAA